MTRPAAKGRTLWPALVAVAVLLTAPQAFASRTASTRSELVPSPALGPTATTAHALAPAYVPQGFGLQANTDPHPASFALFPDLTPPPVAVEPEKLASGVASLELTPNLQRIQHFVAESWQVREKLGPVDSPNLYQAFGLDPQNNTDPLGLAAVVKSKSKVAATYTTCVVMKPQGDVSQRCVDLPGGSVSVVSFTAATDTPDYLRALHQSGMSDEDAAAMVARNAPDSVSIAGTPLGAAAQGGAQAGTAAKPAFHLTMAFVSTAGPGILARTWTLPAASLEGLGDLGTLQYWVRPAKAMPSPRPSGFEAHHGVNSVLMEGNLQGYAAEEAPAVLMRRAPSHNATRGVFNRWRAEIARRQGVKSSDIDWSKVDRGEAWRLAEEQFAAAGTPPRIVEEYFRQFNAYLETLQ